MSTSDTQAQNSRARRPIRQPGRSGMRRFLLAATALTAAQTAPVQTAHAQIAQSGPAGGRVTAGAGSIHQDAGTTTITQSSPTLSLAWDSFNTGAADTVNFVQPSAASIAVNRILDANPTKFLGALNANGQVYLINPNGILFGTSAQINVGGLVASTLDIADADRGAAVRAFSGAGTGGIVNQGRITALSGGYVAFLGNRVANQGTISAPNGTVALGAGTKLTLAFAADTLANLQVDEATLATLAENGGMIQAGGGAVILSAGARDSVLAAVVNNDGLIEARSVRNVNGSIILGGGSQSLVSNSGTLDASGTGVGETGGLVKVLGDTVTLAAGGRIDVSGQSGGGTALVGGNFLGEGPERNAQTTLVAAGASVVADAIGAGAGGRVAVWSDGATQFDGRISARGGAAGGNGGAVETSGHTLKIGADAMVNTLAPRGVAGDWLLDPQDVTIGAYGSVSDIFDYQITSALQTSNVTIKTGPTVSCVGVATCGAGTAGNGDITLVEGAWIGAAADPQGNGVYWTSPTTLTLSAYRNVVVGDYTGIETDLGSGNIVLRADNNATGTGTVILGQFAQIYASGAGNVDIYYNPSSFAAPTNYAALQNGYGDSTFYGTVPRTYMLVNVTAAVAAKTYDGTTAATLTGVTPRALPTGITLSTSGATASFLTKGAGLNKATVVSGVTLAGTNAGQYAINGLDGSTATIAKANLAVSGVSALGKTYDGTTAVTLAGTAQVTPFGSDIVSVGGTRAASFASKTVGTAKPVSVTGYTLSGADAGNYTVIQPAGLTASINQASLAVTGVTAVSKTYDATTAATLSGSASVAALGSDVVSVSGTGVGTFANKNAGTGKAVAVTGYTLSGADAGNYSVVQPAGLTASINKASLAVTGVTAATKTYDATTAATLIGSANVAALGSDVVAVNGTGVGAFGDRNAGTGKAVAVTGYTLSGADAGNYSVVQPAGLTASINQAGLAVTGVTAASKTYDATTAATLSGSASVAALGSDVVAVSGTGVGAFADRNAGTGKAVAVTGYTLSGADAGNYSVVQPAGLTASINQASLAVTGVTAASKTYDATTAATLAGSASVAALGSDVVAVSGTGVGAFADRNAGTGKVITVTGYTLSGADAGNYSVVQPAGLTASIAKASLAVSGITALDKTYDATTAATLSGAASVSAIGGDVVLVSGTGAGSFSDRNAGTAKAVTVTGYTLSGADAANYSIVQPAGLTASINQAGLAVSGVTALDKTYDATTAATLSGAASVSAIGSDVVLVSGTGAGAFADRNAGTAKAVTVTGYTLSGADAGNYSIVQPAGLTASINQAGLTVSGVTALDKTYDATTAATLSGAASVSALGSDVVLVSGTGAGTFADRNAGTAKAVTVTGYTLSGADAGNYSLVQPAGLTASINQAGLAVSGVTALDKTYDATTAATLSGAVSVSALGSDVVSVSGTGAGAFADRNAGTAKAVTVTGYTLSGADAGNYSLVQPAGLTASINQAGLAVSGVTALDKTYDATTAATLAGAAIVSAIGGDVVLVSGTGAGNFADRNAGTAKAVTVTGYTLSGADAGNYSLVQPGGLTASINQAGLAVSGVTALDKTYDATTAATLAGAASVSALGSDVVSVSGTGAGAFADRNAGTAKAVTVTGYTLSGADAANYAVVQPSGLTASINQAGLTVSGVTALDKTYDATTAATLSGAASVSALGSDVVSVSGTGAGAFADRNAGTAKAVTVTGYTLSGADAANYAVIQPSGLTASIDRADLTVAGLGAADKTYDASAAAILTGSASVTALGGDIVSLGGGGVGTFADKNAGTGKLVTVTGYALSGADAGNYTLRQPAGLTASIGRAGLAISGLSIADKVYDGTAAATLDGTPTVAGFAADAVAVTGVGTAAFADRTAGVSRAVTVTGYALGGADAGNYDLIVPTGLTATIGQAALAIGGLGVNAKTYDGTAAATLNGTATVAGFGADEVLVRGVGSALFADRVVGIGKAVAVTGYALGGVDAGNYILVQPVGLAGDIGRAGVTLGGLRVADKLYDGTVAATLSGAAAVTAFGSDRVAVDGAGSAVFADRNVGIDKAVAVTGYTLSGADAANYDLIAPTGLTASIGQARLAIAGVSANDKIYDGTTAATLSGTAAVAAFANDRVTVAGTPSVAFADRNVGTAKQVTASGYTLTGADAGNYELVQPVGLRAAITPATITVAGITASAKDFDGTTSAVVDTSGVTFGGRIGSDAITIASQGAFADPAVAVAATVRLTNRYGGADLGNYTVVDQLTARADIRPLVDAIPALASQRIADGVAQIQSSASSSLRSQTALPLLVANDILRRQDPDEQAAPSGARGMVRVAIGFGPSAPVLQIQNGGIALPTRLIGN